MFANATKSAYICTELTPKSSTIMKRIEFIAPVESMRGSFSPKQTLLYAENNNPAFDAPVGRQYARNYQPVFIGAKRAASGLKFFSCKTKSATLIKPETKMNMAVQGGTGAIIAAILLLAETPGSMYYRAQQAWKNSHTTNSFRKFLDEYVRYMLQNKVFSVNIGRDDNSDIVYIHNPWYVRERPETAYVPAISSETLVKFWMYLAKGDNNAAPITFTVEGQNGIAVTGLDFGNITSVGYYINVLNLSLDDDDNVIMAGEYVKLGDTYQTSTTDIVANAAYTTTDQAPE